MERSPHWSPRALSDTVSCTFSYHTWQFIIFTIFTITTFIFVRLDKHITTLGTTWYWVRVDLSTSWQSTSCLGYELTGTLSICPPCQGWPWPAAIVDWLPSQADECKTLLDHHVSDIVSSLRGVHISVTCRSAWIPQITADYYYYYY